MTNPAEAKLAAALRRYTGLLVTLVALAFIGYVIHSQRVWEADIPWGNVAGFALLGVLIYALSCQILAWAWMLMLRALGGKGLGTWPGCGIYAQTNVAKYLPRRMFHYSSRQVLARRAGTSDASLVLSLLVEALFMLVAAFLWTAPFAAHLLWAVTAHGSFYAVSVLVLFAGIAGFSLWFLYRGNLFQRVRNAGPGGLWILPPLAAALIAYITFFAIWGGVTMMIAGSVAMAPLSVGAATFIAITALGWAVGYVVPGAIAGVGMRDAAMIALLSQYMPPAEAVVVALLCRLITILGDMLFFGAYRLAGKRFPVLRLSPQ